MLGEKLIDRMVEIWLKTEFEGGRHARRVEKSPERLVVGNNLDEAVDRISRAGDKRAVVLASGDPLFYGVARYLCDKLGKDRFEVVPHVSSMQLAFARVKESWEEAYLTNLANRPLDQVLEKIRVATKVGLFTSEDCPPAAVAKALLDRRIDYFSAYVCENLGSPDERVTQGELAEIAAQDFSPLNVMVLVRRPNVPDRPSEAIGRRLFGNPDEAFLQSKPKQGLLTPAEVRSIAAGRNGPGPDEHRVGYRRRQRIGGHRSGPDRLRRHDLRHRNGPRGSSAHHGQCRAIRRPQPGGRAGPSSRGLEGLAGSRQHFRRRQRPRDQPRRGTGLRAAAARRPAGGQRGQHRKPVGRPRNAAARCPATSTCG